MGETRIGTGAARAGGRAHTTALHDLHAACGGRWQRLRAIVAGDPGTLAVVALQSAGAVAFVLGVDRHDARLCLAGLVSLVLDGTGKDLAHRAVQRRLLARPRAPWAPREPVPPRADEVAAGRRARLSTAWPGLLLVIAGVVAAVAVAIAQAQHGSPVRALLAGAVAVGLVGIIVAGVVSGSRSLSRLGVFARTPPAPWQGEVLGFTSHVDRDLVLRRTSDGTVWCVYLWRVPVAARAGDAVAVFGDPQGPVLLDVAGERPWGSIGPH